MKDAHLTVRLPDALAASLDERAEARGVGRSTLVREAVTAYLTGRRELEVTPCRAAELAERWATLPLLTEADRRAMASDLASARERLPAPRDPWA